MNEKVKEKIGNYCLDLSKLIFGGVVVAAIMKEDISLVKLLVFGTIAVVLTAAVGFLFLSLKPTLND